MQEHLRNAPNAEVKPYATFRVAFAAGELRSLEIFLLRIPLMISLASAPSTLKALLWWKVTEMSVSSFVRKAHETQSGMA
jgi:hypothetical protein